MLFCRRFESGDSNCSVAREEKWCLPPEGFKAGNHAVQSAVESSAGSRPGQRDLIARHGERGLDVPTVGVWRFTRVTINA